MTDDRQYCDQCGEDTNIEAMRYFRKDTLLCNFCAYPMLDSYRKLLEFVKKLSRIEQENLRTNMQVAENAKALLQEIGEKSD